jgi:tryptophanase
VKKDVFGARFSVPYEIAVIRPLQQTTVAERRAALEAAHWNTELLPQDLIYIDLCTDSGVSALSTTQLSWQIGLGAVESGMGLAAEASRAYQSLARQCQETFGFDFVIPTTQGRAAERVWIKLHVKPNTVVLGNMLFPSTRTHIEMNGGLVVDVIGDRALDLKSDEPFKGNVDLKKVEAAWREHGKDKISCIYIELSVNACGGHPVSLENLRQVRDFAAANGLPLFFDACRIFENSRLIQQREAGYDHRSIAEIVREICSFADGITMSALKDLCVPSGGLICSRDGAAHQKANMQCFLDGTQGFPAVMAMIAAALQEICAADSYMASRVEQANYLWRRLEGQVPVLRPPGGHAVFLDIKSFLPEWAAIEHRSEALAAFIYERAGIRLTKGPPPAASQVARGIELLRLAIPARKYVQGHLDDVAAALVDAQSRRNEIKALRRLETPGRSKYDPAYFAVT